MCAGARYAARRLHRMKNNFFTGIAMKISKIFGGAAVVTALSLAACGGTAIEGTWLEPIPGMDGEQGFTLGKGGRAESVNMATLKYETWSRKGDRLILTGQSIGNGQTLQFSDTLRIETLDAQTLTVERRGVTSTYRRAAE